MPTLSLANATDLANGIPQTWNKAVNLQADRDSIMGKLTGPDGSRAPFWDKEDLTKVPGDRINFVGWQRLIGKVTTGTSTLQGSEEDAQVWTDVVTVSHRRHATAIDKFALKVTLGASIARLGQLMADWFARRTDDDMIDQILNTDTIQSIYGGGKSSRANVGAGDTLDLLEFKRLRTAAWRFGVKEWQMSRVGRMNFPVYGCMLSEVDYYNLTQDDNFRQDVRLAAERGAGNPILSGKVDMVDGVILYPWAQVSPGDGMYGTFLRPEARLAADITSSATAVTAGPTTAITNVDYWQYFPDTGARTILIDSEQMTYTGTAGSNPGDRSLTVVRGAGGSTAAAHTAGALITFRNISKVLLFGMGAGCRAWAQRMERTGQVYDYGKEIGVGVDWIYGVKGTERNDGTLANCLSLEVWSPNPSTV